MEKLPVYSLNKKKGNLAADYLKRVISNFAVVNIIDESVDLGIDMRAELLKETSPIGLFFKCKVYENDIVLSRAEYVQLEKILTSGKENENAKNFILKRRKNC